MIRVTIIVVGFAALVSASSWDSGRAMAQEGIPNTPIEHLIVLMQENHSFDNYFGTYPGADGHPAGTCQLVSLDDPEGPCIEPFHIGDMPVLDLSHNAITHADQFNEGQMDGFVDAHTRRNADGTMTMGFYDDRDLPYYWNIADEYVLFDRFFSSAAGGSIWNHLFWTTGTPGNPDDDSIPPGLNGFGDLLTIFDRLEDAGISWKFYVQNYDANITYRNQQEGDRGAQVVWVPLLSIPRFLDNPELHSRIVDLDEYYEDLQQGTLPSVAYMVPSGASEHPPGSIQAGQRFVRTVINELMRSDIWSTSAFMWTYDDWGGWYDHVSPPKVDEFGYGFRVPTLLVSPYAKQGYIDSTVLDYTSVLKFIEENWDLEPLAERDAAASSFSSAFDFTQEPRPPRFLPADRSVGNDVDFSSIPIVYLAYTAGVAVFATVLYGGIRNSNRSRSLARARTKERERSGLRGDHK